MPSSRRALLLRRSVAIAGCLFSSVVRAAAAEPDAAAPAGTPLSPQELDPTAAFSERVIVLVRTPGDDGVMARLRADLRESQWRILEIRPDERFERPPLGASAERERASAAIRVDAPRGVIELWVLRPDGPVEETIVASDEQHSEQVLALRGAEALRARGLLPSRPEQGSPVPPVPDATQTPPVVDAPPPPRAKSPPSEAARLWLALGPGVALSPGGLGPLPLAELGLRLDFAERWSLHADGLLPVSPQTIAAAEGEAEVATYIVSGALDFEWARLPFGGVRSGIGAGGAVTTMSGDADTSGFDGATDTVTTFALLLNSSFHADLTKWLRLRSAVVLGATLPEVSVRFGSNEVASWGRPLFAASVALEASPPR
jgi:hypothetical protein